jgi:inosine/xanthosine triphosphatase
MLVAVGTTNPVKIAAAEAVLRRVYGEDVRVVPVDVPSGVSPQPWGDAETLRGALNRARAARDALCAELGVGLEGGLLEVDGQVFTNAWCAVVRDDGIEGVGGGENMLLPPAVVAALRAGEELGLTIDALTGVPNTKRKGGAIGALTRGWLDRQTAYEHILTLALARLLSPEYYRESANSQAGALFADRR